MNRLHIWAVIAVMLGAAVAVFDLFTGWMVNGGTASLVVGLGLFGGSFVLLGAMLIGVISDRRRIVVDSTEARRVLARAARGVRWSSIFAFAFAVLLFANCSGGFGTSGPPAAQTGPPPDPAGLPVISGGQAVIVSGPVSDPAHFWVLTAWVLAPLLLAVLAPAVLTFAAERLATARPQAARRLGFLALWSMAAVAAAAFATFAVGFLVGFNACLQFGMGSAGYCSAGAGSFMNPLSIGTLALFLPYLLLIPGALAQIEANRAR